VVLEATHSHSVFLDHIYQDHLSAARRTRHRRPPTKRFLVVPIVPDYLRCALAPLGYTLIIEATAQETGQPAAGFGSGGKPDFWIGGEGKLEKPVHIAITAKDRPAVDAFHRAALAAGGRDNGPPGLP
jgi:hypothetical protein